MTIVFCQKKCTLFINNKHRYNSYILHRCTISEPLMRLYHQFLNKVTLFLQKK